MDAFFSIGQLSNCDLLSINCCWGLTKQALTVANVCTGDRTAIWCNTLLPQVAPYPSTLIWECKQPSHKDWQIWSQALQLAFGPQLIIAIPLGGWLQTPHQPMVHLPYDLASNVLYQPGHHGVWYILWQPPNALVMNRFTCYAYMGVTTTVPPTAYYLAIASPELAQMLHFQGSSLKPLPSCQWLPCQNTFVTYGKSKPDPYTPLSSPTKARPLCWVLHIASIKLKIDRTVGVGVFESEFDWRSRILTEDTSVFVTTDRLLEKSTTINFHIDLSVQFLWVFFSKVDSVDG